MASTKRKAAAGVRLSLPKTSSASQASSQFELRQRHHGRFIATGGGERERLSASLAPATHRVLAQLAEDSGLPRSYTIDAMAALVRLQPELLSAVLQQLGQEHHDRVLPAMGVFERATGLIKQQLEANHG